MSSLRWCCVLALLLAAGCATTQSVRWNREDIRPKGVRGDRQLDQVRLWSGDSVFQWHWVVITTDSITGVPDERTVTCQGCRRTLPLSAVDSLRVGYREGEGSARTGFGGDLALIGLILLALLTP